MERSTYVIRGGVEGRERLRILARVMRPTTRSLLERVGLCEGLTCLDVGCGGGDATIEIARLVGPGGRVVGVDIDETKIAIARQEAADLQVSNVAFRVADIANGEGEREFDFVYARFLLTHLQDPESALGRMRGVLRPGGKLALEDIDFRGHFCHPESTAFARYLELYTQVVRQRGADPNIGPRLPAMLVGSGFADVQMNVVHPAGMDGDVKLIAALTMENIADAVRKERLASREEVDAIVRDLYALAEDRRTVMSAARVVQTWANRGS